MTQELLIFWSVVGGGMLGIGLYIFVFGRPCGRHSFAPRYDRIHYAEKDGDKYRDVYVRDVCVSCGATRERDEE